MIVNFSQRAHNHNFESDWAVRSLLDTDFYKLLMLQFIWKHFPDVPVSFGLINRTKSVRLADELDEAELRRQLDHVRELRFRRSELIWLAGNTFYGRRGIFEPEFIEWLADFELPPYRLERRDGQFELRFDGPWTHSTMWEIYGLSIVNELRTRAGLARMTEFELDIFYARAKAKLWDKIERLRGVQGLAVADFGTRRRHSFLWQEFVVQAMEAELDGAFTGTSNAYIAFKHDLEAIGTNAHELPMVLAALATDDRSLADAQYRVLELWQRTYGGALLVMLPDTYGTTQFLERAPQWVTGWTGIRIDSKNPATAGEEYIDWLTSRGVDPRDKRILFSDGLDVGDILDLHARFAGRIKAGYGWGTLLTNDFRGCHPRRTADFEPISLVCKVKEAGGRPAVKLSDNYLKATGPAAEIARYRALFGTAGVANVPVLV
ncbi:nicotinate phosphoribosyltransferase [Aliidongia dinghuensis]|uniref:Nicotinate phosphoribosyltransferase n=1 Tax=Aliidongia dinghuensis TaxID=1867774 RepID=A0A8J3E3E4_9PROT|nr:nicotinate phosphoribosyltransferase [Aliidongia dinghuensis]GGF17906.1 nicotinate phosphoribosyltransferase [Aliidongia dinghuensis]